MASTLLWLVCERVNMLVSTNVPMMANWWEVVKTMANFVITGYEEKELTEDYVKNDLLSLGYVEEDVDTAVDWVKKAELSGHLSESLAMLQPQVNGVRIADPLEKICFSEGIWAKIESCRQRGILSNDLVEKLIEGVRALDTRDWEDDEISHLLAEIVVTLLPNMYKDEFIELLEGRKKVTYC